MVFSLRRQSPVCLPMRFIVYASRLRVGPAVHADKGLLTERHQRTFLAVESVDLQLADRERATGPKYFAGGLKVLALSRRHQIDFELDGQHRAAFRKQGEAGVATGRVSNGTG